MPTTPVVTYSNNQVKPYIRPDLASMVAVKLAASLDLAAGTVLGEATGTNELQSITITGSPTGGTLTISYAGQTTGDIAYNAQASAVQTALEALSNVGDGNVKVTGGPLPIQPILIEFIGALGAGNRAEVTTTNSFTGGSSPNTTVATARAGAAGTLGTFKAYDNDNTDGSGVAKAILPFAVQTDSAGKITYSDTTAQAGGEWGETQASVPVYIAGYFHTDDLVGLDSVAVGQMGRMVVGIPSDGIFALGL